MNVLILLLFTIRLDFVGLQKFTHFFFQFGVKLLLSLFLSRFLVTIRYLLERKVGSLFIGPMDVMKSLTTLGSGTFATKGLCHTFPVTHLTLLDSFQKLKIFFGCPIIKIGFQECVVPGMDLHWCP
eukprot:11057.XXX_565097_565474_1 [CDS] Oithona nana genome sequencing.